MRLVHRHERAAQTVEQRQMRRDVSSPSNVDAKNVAGTPRAIKPCT
jgi:hypothetical protein